MYATHSAIAAGILLAGMSGWESAHPGGLNSEGCHNNRKTGDYHCHGGGGSAPAPQRYETASSFLDASEDRTASGRPFKNCTEARAAGHAPIRHGEPGFGPHLDRDGDGIGCESYRGR